MPKRSPAEASSSETDLVDRKALIALLNVGVSTRNERRRSQPVVVVHGVGSRRFAEGLAAFVFGVCD